MAARRRRSSGRSSRSSGGNPIWAWILVLLAAGFMIYMYKAGEMAGAPAAMAPASWGIFR